MPEWMYRDMYDEKHKILQASRESDKITKRQKGLYASFMCFDCEKESQKYDHYASLILARRSKQSDECKSIHKVYHEENYRNNILQFGRWQNICFEYFQKFVFSIVLRTHFSGMMKDPITLTEKHVNRILALYKDQNTTGTGVGPSYHIDNAGIIPPKRVFSDPISSFSTPKSAL